MTNASPSRTSNRRRRRQQALSESLHQHAATVALLQERIAELERDDSGWQAIAQGDTREFSREGLNQIMALARIMYLKNPLINRGVSVQAFYVWAQGMTVQARDADVNAVIQAFLDDPKNQVELTGHQARTLKEIDLQLDGNLFFVFFVNAVTGRVQLRTIPPDEIRDIVCNPEDRKDPRYYRREWTEQRIDERTGTPVTAKRSAYYPDWRYQLAAPPTARPQKLGDVPILWSSPVYHVKTGGLSDMRFGVSEVYAAIDWARAYKSFLEDWATRNAALAKFAWRATSKHGKKGVQAIVRRMATTSGSAATEGRETNPPPPAGAVAAMDDGTTFDPIKISGANVGTEEGRRLLLMVAAALGLPETFFGDVSVGTLATATSLDRPTELKMRDRQTLWSDIFRTVFSVVLLHAVRAPQGPLRGRATVAGDQLSWNTGTDGRIDIAFPPILRVELPQLMAAIDKTAQRVPDARLIARLMLTALGVDDIDEILDVYFDARGQLKPEYRPQPQTPGDPAQDRGADPPSPTDAEATNA